MSESDLFLPFLLVPAELGLSYQPDAKHSLTNERTWTNHKKTKQKKDPLSPSWGDGSRANAAKGYILSKKRARISKAFDPSPFLLPRTRT